MLEEVKDVEEFAQSLRDFIGLPKERADEVSLSALSEPEQLNELLRSLLVEFFGMEVRGL